MRPAWRSKSTAASTTRNKTYDAARDLAFTDLGLLVLRFRNEVITANMSAVLARIGEACAERITAQLNPRTE